MAVEFVRSSQRMGGIGECRVLSWRVPSAIVVINVYRVCTGVGRVYTGSPVQLVPSFILKFFGSRFLAKFSGTLRTRPDNQDFLLVFFFFFRGSQLEWGFIKSGALFEKSKEFKIFKSQIEKIKNKKVDKEIPMLHYSQNPVCLCLLVLLPFPFSQVDSVASWKSRLDKQKGENC